SGGNASRPLTLNRTLSKLMFQRHGTYHLEKLIASRRLSALVQESKSSFRDTTTTLIRLLLKKSEAAKVSSVSRCLIRSIMKTTRDGKNSLLTRREMIWCRALEPLCSRKYVLRSVMRSEKS